MNRSNEYRDSLSLEQLKGMQSVRATFRLPVETIELLSIAAQHLGLKQKSIFDHLLRDDRFLDEIAGEALGNSPEEQQIRQKTFVLSRNSLDAIEAAASRHELSRDVLAQFSIQRLIPVVDAECQRNENRKAFLGELKDFFKTGRKVLEQAENLLGGKDPMFGRIALIIGLLEENIRDLEQAVEKGDSLPWKAKKSEKGGRSAITKE